MIGLIKGDTRSLDSSSHGPGMFAFVTFLEEDDLSGSEYLIN